MKRYSKLISGLGAFLLITACQVDKTEEGQMPRVGVEGGQLPKYEINKTQEGRMPDVNVDAGKMPEYDVRTPDVKVGSETREVTVPTVDIDLPEDDDEANRRGLSNTERDD